MNKQTKQQPVKLVNYSVPLSKEVTEISGKQFLENNQGSIETNDLNVEKYDNSHQNQEISILRNHVNKEIHCAQGHEKRKTQ